MVQMLPYFENLSEGMWLNVTRKWGLRFVQVDADHDAFHKSFVQGW